MSDPTLDAPSTHDLHTDAGVPIISTSDRQELNAWHDATHRNPTDAELERHYEEWQAADARAAGEGYCIVAEINEPGNLPFRLCQGFTLLDAMQLARLLSIHDGEHSYGVVSA